MCAARYEVKRKVYANTTTSQVLSHPDVEQALPYAMQVRNDSGRKQLFLQPRYVFFMFFISCPDSETLYSRSAMQVRNAGTQ